MKPTAEGWHRRLMRAVALLLLLGGSVVSGAVYAAQSDILWQNTSNGERVIWFMNGSTNIGGVSLFTIATNWKIAGTGDFNGDGKTDILWRDASNGERVIWFMNGPTYMSGVSLGVVSTDWQIAGALRSTAASWVGVHQLGTAGDDIGQGIATDASGNVYVTGYTSGDLDGNASSGGADLFVVKYDSGGVKQQPTQSSHTLRARSRVSSGLDLVAESRVPAGRLWSAGRGRLLASTGASSRSSARSSARLSTSCSRRTEDGCTATCTFARVATGGRCRLRRALVDQLDVVRAVPARAAVVSPGAEVG